MNSIASPRRSKAGPIVASDAPAGNARLNLALLVSLALHAVLLGSFATHAGLRSGGQPLAENPAAQPLSVALRQPPPLADPLPLEEPPRLAADFFPAPRSEEVGAAGGDSGPLPLSPIAAAYPEGAIAMGVAAKVEVRALVDEAGRVEEANVVSATLADVFDRSALAAVRATRFVPATTAGKPVKSSYRAVIFYDLK